MAHVVTERCVDCRYTDCCVVCPVECFYETTSPAMLVIDPDTCIDCALCVPECPIQAIWPEDELPEVYRPWVQKNAELFGGGTKIKIKKDALPSALPLAPIQTREKSKGWAIDEPKGAGGGEHAEAVPAAPVEAVSAVHQFPTPAGLSSSASAVFSATANGKYRWRSAKGLAAQLRLPIGSVQSDLDQLVSAGHLKKQPPKTKGTTVFGAKERVGA